MSSTGKQAPSSSAKGNTPSSVITALSSVGILSSMICQRTSTGGIITASVRRPMKRGRMRQDVWSKRQWEAPESDAGASPPTFFTDENRPTGFQPQVLTGGEKSGRLTKHKGLIIPFHPHWLFQRSAVNRLRGCLH